jgi:hypothetical protein
VGLREQLRRIKREMGQSLDYLELVDGSRFYFDPEQVSMELFFEMLEKGYTVEPGTTKDVETPEIREALVRATPESLARFQEKYVTATAETGVVYSEDLQTVRRIDLDGSVKYFLVEGEPARQMLADYRGRGLYSRTEREPIQPGPGIR